MTAANAANASTFGADAARYALYRPTYREALFEWLADIAPGRQRAWDIGCGSGQATGPLAARFSHVIACDTSAEQLVHASRLRNVDWQVGAAETMVLEPLSIDLVIAASSFHWLDVDALFPQLLRTLRPDGVFAAFGYGASLLAPTLHAAARSAFTMLSPFWADGNRALWRGYADTSFPLEPIDAPAFSIELDWTLDRYLDYASTWSACRRCIVETGVDLLPMARAQLAPLWGDGTQHISMPLTVKVGRKRREIVSGGAGGGTRTLTPLLVLDFESSASTSSAIPARAADYPRKRASRKSSDAATVRRRDR